MGASFGEYEGRPTVGGPPPAAPAAAARGVVVLGSMASMARRVNSLQGSTQLRRSREGQTFSIFLISNDFSGSGRALKMINMANAQIIVVCVNVHLEKS